MPQEAVRSGSRENSKLNSKLQLELASEMGDKWRGGVPEYGKQSILHLKLEIHMDT